MISVRVRATHLRTPLRGLRHESMRRLWSRTSNQIILHVCSVCIHTHTRRFCINVNVFRVLAISRQNQARRGIFFACSSFVIYKHDHITITSGLVLDVEYICGFST